jgi:hypothetical protein
MGMGSRCDAMGRDGMGWEQLLEAARTYDAQEAQLLEARVAAARST